MNDTYQPANADNVAEILRKFADYVEGDDPEARAQIAEDVNEFLDGLCEQDYFGTEMQCDPRGDQRE